MSPPKNQKPAEATVEIRIIDPILNTRVQTSQYWARLVRLFLDAIKPPRDRKYDPETALLFREYVRLFFEKRIQTEARLIRTRAAPAIACPACGSPADPTAHTSADPGGIARTYTCPACTFGVFQTVEFVRTEDLFRAAGLSGRAQKRRAGRLQPAGPQDDD